MDDLLDLYTPDELTAISQALIDETEAMLERCHAGLIPLGEATETLTESTRELDAMSANIRRRTPSR